MIKKYSIYIILILIILSLSATSFYFKKESKRHEVNYNAMEQTAINYKSNYKGTAVQLRSVELSQREFKKSSDSIIRGYLSDIKDLKIKVKNLSTGIVYNTETILYDSVLVTDTIYKDRIHEMFKYSNKFWNVNFWKPYGQDKGILNIKYFGYYTISLHRYKPLKPNGKPYRFIRKWLKRKVSGATLTCEDENMIFKDIRIINVN
jgi:hypothetical protein